MRARPLAYAALGVPVLAWFGLLAALWFNAPIWDDYDTILRSANRLHRAAEAAVVRVRDGRTDVQDGPFADTREELGGYFHIEAPDLDTAIAWAAR